jgi:hypothetical protein
MLPSAIAAILITPGGYEEYLFWIPAMTLAESAITLAFPAFRQDGLVQTLPQILRQLVNLMAAVNLDGLARGAQRDLAVFAAPEMLFKVGAQGNRGILIEHFVQLR